MLSKTLTNMRRTPYQAAAAILVLTITFFVADVVGFASISFYQAFKYFETRPQVLIFFKTDAVEDQINAVQQQLKDDTRVSSVTYVPKEQALDIYKDLNKNDPVLLELVTADILPASLEISTFDLPSLKSVASEVQNSPGVDEVALRSDIVDVLNNWLTGIRLGGISFVGLLAATSILIVVIIVGMKISGKQYEIKILELIGASHWYIQGPFLLEGVLYGFFSALLAYIISVTLLLYSTPYIIQFAGEVPLLPTAPLSLILIFTVSVLLGVMIGFSASWIALKRFLKL